MDNIFSLIFLLWAAFAILEGFSRKLKPPVPPPNLPLPPQSSQPSSEQPDFEIPTLLNEPANLSRLPSESANLTIEPVNSSNHLSSDDSDDVPTPKLNSSSAAHLPSDTLLSNLSQQNDFVSALILSEIFSKPKSFRKR